MKSRLWPFLVALALTTGCQAYASAPAPSATAGPPTTPGAVQKPAATATPTIKATSTPAAKPTEEPNITIASPKAGDTLKGNVRVSGTARVFEAALIVAVKDSIGKVLVSRPVMASAGAPERGTYAVDLPFSVSTAQSGTVEAYSQSPKDGSVQNLVTVKVTLAPK